MVSDLLPAARLILSDDAPYSEQFDDIYFSPDDGVGESRYNFIDGNDLPRRWQNLSADTFTIAETGFGTGLNFLLTASAWQTTVGHSESPPTLHYISAEKYPIAPRDLAALYQQQGWQDPICTTLLAEYPHLNAGCHHVVITPNIRLTLLLGDARQGFSDYPFTTDAWFLDGFAPAKNPDLWSPELFEMMAERSRVGSTFATFTAASAVRRGLQDAGFLVKKQKGFGRKRERLLGHFLGGQLGDNASPQHQPDDHAH